MRYQRGRYPLTPVTSQESRRSEALRLAEDLLGEIELSTISPNDIARKASRLARLIDDSDAMRWLKYETTGYPSPLDSDATAAAIRSSREAPPQDLPAGKEGPMYQTGSAGQIATVIEAAKVRLPACSNPPERDGTIRLIQTQQGYLDAVVGSIHTYVAERYQELRFGAAVESAFEVVRREVDTSIGDLVPDALPMLTSAFENATSSNPEDSANAAGTCRRLLKAAADQLCASGPDIEGRKMGDGNYINRLIHWITTNAESETVAAMVAADLDYLGRRLDAADHAGQKGAHATVDRFEASRFITGTYLVLGDVLRIAPSTVPPDRGTSAQQSSGTE
ncbi:MAG TPA: hypothetical protein VG816_14805 [Solirubrobacterales bacterium]|nr:hypothetical protein [Solirubrobacterales bacterium]